MSRSAVSLRLNGKPLNLIPQPPTFTKTLKILNASSADQLYTVEEIARRVGTNPAYLRTAGSAAVFEKHTLRLGKVRYWGNPRAIKALAAQVQP